VRKSLIGILLVLVSLTALVAAPAVTFAQTTAEEEAKEVIREAAPDGEVVDEAVEGAQETAEEGIEGEPATQPAQRPQSFLQKNFIWIMLAVLVFMWFFMGRGRRKKEAQRKAMLAALGKGDKVTSIGGIVGTVVEVRDDEVTIKVDETNNIRMRFARWAIRGIGEQAKTETPEDQQK